MATGITAVLRLAADHPVLGAVVEHEPELVLPHFAFHQLDGVLALAEGLCRPHLGRFLPADEVRRLPTCWAASCSPTPSGPRPGSMRTTRRRSADWSTPTCSRP